MCLNSWRQTLQTLILHNAVIFQVRCFNHSPPVFLSKSVIFYLSCVWGNVSGKPKRSQISQWIMGSTRVAALKTIRWAPNVESISKITLWSQTKTTPVISAESSSEEAPGRLGILLIRRSWLLLWKHPWVSLMDTTRCLPNLSKIHKNEIK